MQTGWTRRDFLGNAATIGAGSLGVFGKLPRVSAAEARVDAGMVRFRPEIEPLVRLLELTPQERLLKEVELWPISKPVAHRRRLRMLHNGWFI